MHKTNILGQERLPESENGVFNLYDQNKGWSNTWGYQSIKYDSNTDPIERVDSIIQIWKNTAIHHEFKSNALAHLTCLPSEEGHILTYPLSNNKETGCKSIRCKVEKIDTSVDIDHEPLSVARLRIEGKNLKTGMDFVFNLKLNLSCSNKDRMLYKENKKYIAWGFNIK